MLNIMSYITKTVGTSSGLLVASLINASVFIQHIVGRVYKFECTSFLYCDYS